MIPRHSTARTPFSQLSLLTSPVTVNGARTQTDHSFRGADGQKFARESATLDGVRVSRISKIAGLSLAGLVVASVAADKVNIGPVASQVAGFAGAFIGSLIGRRGTRTPQSSKQHEALAEVKQDAE